ncbi:hypothetical protein ACFTAO_51025 [Paenibacillus rhizoplanae]
MAADAPRWFGSDPVLDAIQQFHITSVIALAPTDKNDRQQAGPSNGCELSDAAGRA